MPTSAIEIVPPQSLRLLRDCLNNAPRDREARVAYAEAHGLPTKHGEIAFDDLPTFGGAEPSSTDGVYSWSEGQLLICDQPWFGAGNQLNSSTVLNPWTVVPRDPLAHQLSDLIADASLSVSRFSRAIGRDRGTVEAWLTGETVLPETMRRWIARATVESIEGAVRLTVTD